MGLCVLILLVTAAHDSGERAFYVEGRPETYGSLGEAMLALSAANTTSKLSLKTDDWGWYKRVSEASESAKSRDGTQDYDCFPHLVSTGVVSGLLFAAAGALGFMAVQKTSFLFSVIVSFQPTFTVERGHGSQRPCHLHRSVCGHQQSDRSGEACQIS